jgi:hypothetical protein
VFEVWISCAVVSVILHPHGGGTVTFIYDVIVTVRRMATHAVNALRKVMLLQSY